MTSDGGEKASIVHIHVLGRSLSGTMLPNHDAGWLTDRGPRLIKICNPKRMWFTALDLGRVLPQMLAGLRNGVG